jgi:hypothetical protein
MDRPWHTPPDVVVRNRDLLASAEVETIIDEHGKTWMLRRLPATAQPDALLEPRPVRAHTRLFSRRIA